MDVGSSKVGMEGIGIGIGIGSVDLSGAKAIDMLGVSVALSAAVFGGPSTNEYEDPSPPR